MAKWLTAFLLICLVCCREKGKDDHQSGSDSSKIERKDSVFNDVLTSDSHVPKSSQDTGRHQVYYESMNEAVENKIDNLLVFHIRDTMEVNSVYKATLALSKQQTLEAIKEDVISSTGNPGKFYVDSSLKIASTMKAVLKDLETGKNFEINLIGDGTDVQDIDSLNEYKAFWEWSIKPLKEGQHKLELVVEVVVNRTRKIYLPSRTIPVIISSTPESFGDKLSSFFSRNWQWMIGAVFIPFAIALFNRRPSQPKKRRR